METFSNNDKNLTRSIRTFLVPSLTEVIIYIMAATLMVLVLNGHQLWLLFTNSSQISSNNVRDAFSAQTFFLDSHDLSDKLGTASVFLVWGFIGSACYMSVWAVQHFYRRASEDIKGADYSMPQTARSSYWHTRVAQNIYLVANLLVFASFLVFSIPFLVGVKKLGLLTLENLSHGQDYKYLLIAILISSVYLYIFAKLWIITRYTFHLYFRED